MTTLPPSTLDEPLFVSEIVRNRPFPGQFDHRDPVTEAYGEDGDYEEYDQLHSLMVWPIHHDKIPPDVELNWSPVRDQTTWNLFDRERRPINRRDDYQTLSTGAPAFETAIHYPTNQPGDNQLPSGGFQLIRAIPDYTLPITTSFLTGLYNVDINLINTNEFLQMLEEPPMKNNEHNTILRTYNRFYSLIENKRFSAFGHPNADLRGGPCWGANRDPWHQYQSQRFNYENAIQNSHDIFSNHTCMDSPLRADLGAPSWRLPTTFLLFSTDANKPTNIEARRIDTANLSETALAKLITFWSRTRARFFNLSDGEQSTEQYFLDGNNPSAHSDHSFLSNTQQASLNAYIREIKVYHEKLIKNHGLETPLLQQIEQDLQKTADLIEANPTRLSNLPPENADWLASITTYCSL